MQVQIETRDSRNSGIRDHAESRVRFVLRRLDWMVARAQVRLSDANGPRGGIDKQCQVMLKTGRGGVLVIHSAANDWRSALDSALERAARLLVRVWRRRRGFRQNPRYAASGN